MQQLHLIPRRRFMIAACIMLLMVLIHVYWMNAFLVYADSAITAPYAAWPRVPLAAESPFMPFGPLGSAAGLAIDLLLASQLGNWIILPWIVIWMCIRLRDGWRTTAWYERSAYIAVLIVTLPALATMWSPLGQAVYTWIVD